MPARVQQPSEERNHEKLLSAISRIFDQAAVSLANHRKNFVALHKIHQELAQFTEELRNGQLVKLTGEKMVEKRFQELFMRVVPLRKGEPSGDRIVKFVGGYIKFINEKASEDKSKMAEESDDEDQDTTASRFTERLLRLLLDGFLAKDKSVRFRVLQTVAEMISHLGEVDEAVYRTLRAALIERLNDKEWTIRLQAVISLAKLSFSEDPADLGDEQSIVDILLEAMAYDHSSEVRRAILINIPINSHTLDAILDRTRDTDTIMRKVVYDSVLGDHSMEKVEGGSEGEQPQMGPTHPRALSIAQRELVVRTGLGDREHTVRAMAANLMATWVDVCSVKAEEAGPPRIESGVQAFLTLFDLYGGNAVAVDALLSVFSVRVDIFNNIVFDEHYWGNFTPEKAFLVRVFVDHCINTKDDTRLEATLPVVTAIAFRIQETYNSLLDDQEFLATAVEILDDERLIKDDEKASKELTLTELLRLAVNLDYSDEIGRRKMFQLVRDMLRRESLPTSLMEPCLDVMRILSDTERDLIRLVVETVQGLRDDVYEDDEEEVEKVPDGDPDASFDEPVAMSKPVRKSLEEMSPEQRKRVDQVDLRSLSLCIGMLERVNSTFEENIMLDGVLRELIIPSVQRKEAVFRERGLKCLGLCCLIAKRLALQSINLFMNQIPSAQGSIKITLVQSLFDILMVHENALFKDLNNDLDTLTKFLVENIKLEQDPVVKANFCKGTSKLVLSGMITDVNVIKNLIKTFVSPSTIDNQELRQCLAFFLPMYSHSSPANQKRMREIFIHVFLDVCQDRKEAKKTDEDELVISSTQLGAMFVDWTDPLRLISANNARGDKNSSSANECVHLDMAEDILKTLFEKDLKVTIEKEDKRVLCQLLSKLHIPDVVDDYQIRSLKLLISTLRSRRPFRDSSSNTALTKFDATVAKKFEKQLENFSEEEFRKFEELNELFEFLDSIIPLDEDEFIDLDAPKKGRKRRSESTTTQGDSRPGSPPSENSKGKRKAKRARFSTSDGDDDEDEHSAQKGSQLPPSVPTRSLPKRAAVRKPIIIQPIVISSDSEEDGEKTAPASRRQKNGARYRPSIKEEVRLDEDIDNLLQHSVAASTSTSSEVPYDSIMDPDSEEEEDEVNDLLAEK